MTTELDAATECVADIAEELMLEFQPALPPSSILSVVTRASRDLDGQVIDGAFPEMLMRLSKVRLTQMDLDLTACRLGERANYFRRTTDDDVHRAVERSARL